MPLDQEEKVYPYERNMGFFDHIDELRKYLFRMAVALFIGIVISFIFIKEAFDILIMGPLNKGFWGYKFYCKIGRLINNTDFLCFDPPPVSLQSTAIQGQFVSAFKISFVMGFVITFPFIIYQLWLFIKPALSVKEVKNVNKGLFMVSFLFFAGLLFSYFLMVPLATNFLLSFQLGSQIQNIITINSVTGFVCFMSLAGGIVFQLPVLIYILARIGLITSSFLLKYWRYAVLVIFIIAGIATPSPDVFSQLVLGLPLMVLYFLGIYVAKRVEKDKAIKEKEYE